jgi:hypothetical protein
MNDRIRLAEAMGWEHNKGWPVPYDGDWWKSPDGNLSVTLDFDPYTDANDDYAVLEWMRLNGAENMPDDFPHSRQAYYKIGDYARAALKVIDSQEQE